MDDGEQREIARGLREGSPQAWRRLYEAYAPRVWREVARLMGGNSAHVADVVQEIFLAAAGSARGFDPHRGSLWMWLWGIARRQVALHYRKHTRAEDLQRARQWWISLNGQKVDWIDGRTETPPEVLESRELAVLVRNSLAELPAEYQTLLTGKYMDGVSVEQLASETNRSQSAVRSKLARARRAFRKVFESLTLPMRFG